MSVTDFSPASGSVGTRVTVIGTGFRNTPSENTVKFNGVSATVVSSTRTEIVADVPSGATTGPISVTNPDGSATSAAPFAVGTSAPLIASFSPTIGTPTTNVTIVGTNFDPVPANNIVKFNVAVAQVVSATPTSIVATVPDNGTSGHISVTTPGGMAVSADDFFVAPPFSGPLNLILTGRMTIGRTKPLTFNNGSDSALLVFDGVQGQRVSLQLTDNQNNFFDLRASIISPDGGTLAFINPDIITNFIDAVELPTTGTYTIAVTTGGGSGSVTVRLFSVVDVTGTISIDGPAVPLTISTPGQNARFTFSANAGQRANLRLTSVTVSSFVTILDPDGNAVGFTNSVGTGGLLIRIPPLPVAGTYTIFVDPSFAGTGGMTMTLSTPPPEATGTITIDGPLVTATTTIAGQDARVTFAGTAGQLLSLQMTSVTIPTSTVYVFNPDGSVLLGPIAVDTRGWFNDLPALPVTGTYSILIVPDSDNIGSMTLSLFTQSFAPITPGGPSVPVTIATPNQVGRFSFNGTAGQRVSLNAANVTISRCTLRILNPDGSVLASANNFGLVILFIDTQVLPVTGIYKILVIPDPFQTGSLTLTLYDVPADLTGTLSIGGPSLPVTVGTPGQNAVATFAGNSTQQVTVRVTGNTMSCVAVTLVRPAGTTQTTLTSCSASFNLTTQTLATTGTYSIRIDPFGPNTGSLNVSVTSP